MEKARPFVLFALGLAACGSAATPSPPSPLVVARPYNSNIPRGYHGQPSPLLLLLHGYGVNSILQDAYFGFTNLSEAHHILYAFPDGNVDSMGNRFWNATDNCCDFDHTNVDDVAYLNAVIDDMRRQYNVDAKRIFIAGHSNGGFMAHRMACDAASRVAAIASLAGAVWKDPSRCQPTGAVSILQIHGDQDDMVPYNGGPDLPSAHETVATWANKDHCTGPLAASGAPLDLDMTVDGAETTVEAYGGCPSAAVQLWTMAGVGHLPNIPQPQWGETLWAFLSAHPKP